MRTCSNCDKSINECPYKEFNPNSESPCIFERDNEKIESNSSITNDDDDDLEYLFLDNKEPKIKPFNPVQRIIAIILITLFFGGLIAGAIYSLTSPDCKKKEPVSEINQVTDIEEPDYVYELPKDLGPVTSVPEPIIEETECLHTKTFTKKINDAYRIPITDDGQCYSVCSFIEVYCSDCGELLHQEEQVTDTVHNIRIISEEVVKEYIHTKDTIQNEETKLTFGCSCGEYISDEVLTFDTKTNPEAPFYNTTPGIYTYITKIASHSMELINYEITPTEYITHFKCMDCDYTEDESYPLIFEDSDHDHDHNE